MFKRIVKNLLPYGVIVSRRRRIINSTFTSFNTDSTIQLPNNTSLFKTILSVQGFGYSGHTALLNLFQEYKSIQECIKTTTAGESSYEIDFMRLGGGILEFEKYINSSNLFQNDAAFHRLLKQMSSCRIFKEEQKCKDYADSYLTQLLDMKLDNLSTVYYNVALTDRDCPDTTIYYTRKFSRTDFRKLTQRFLTSFFNVFSRQGKDVLMLDHFFTDLEWDMQTYTEYVPGIKVIAVFRDPRDVYYYANIKNVEWIPHQNVDNFIKWCGKTYGKFDFNSKEYYPLRFEDLIMDYEATVKKLEEYVGLKSEDHVDKFKFLNPEISKNNIAIWKKAPELFSDMEKIKAASDGLCYK